MISKKKYKFNPKRWIRYNYLKLIRMKDSPQKIAGGMALGSFLGVLPGFGTIAAIILATILRVNRGSAILGSLIFNTAVTVPIWIVSYPIGSFMTGNGWQFSEQTIYLLRKHNWKYAFIEGGLNLLFGIATVSLIVFLLIYWITYVVVSIYQEHVRKKRAMKKNHLIHEIGGK